MEIPVVIANGNRFRVESTVSFEGKRVTLRPVGVLDEHADLDVVVEYLSKLSSDIREIVFDLEKVATMNSCGIRSWLIFIEKVEKNHAVRFEKASEVFVEQASVVPNVFGKSTTAVASFCAPFFCEKCRTRSYTVLSPKDVRHRQGDGQSAPVLPEFKCAKCDKALEFDGIPQEYFAFLQNQ